MYSCIGVQLFACLFSVYVFLGTYNGIVDMMTNMYDRGLLDTGEYVVIYYDHETVDTIDPLKFYRSKLLF